MAVNTAKVTGRRTLRFNSIAEAIADAESVVSTPCHPVGNWTTGQVLDHLARTVRVMFEGPHIPAPWFVRTVIAPFMKRNFISGTISPGFQFTPQMAAFRPDENAEPKSALDEFRKQFSRLQREAPTAPNPFLGELTHQEWIGTNLRHCELHLSFLISDGG